MVKPNVCPIADAWPDTALPVSGDWRNLFTGATLSGDTLSLRDVFAAFPVAVLEKA
jgi:maltooligosyltrehalose synthase